jgi:hypothetical protein
VRKRNPPATRRRALELLAASRDGATEAIMLAHGFSIEQMVELVRVGLATAKAERVVAGERAIEVATALEILLFFVCRAGCALEHSP